MGWHTSSCRTHHEGSTTLNQLLFTTADTARMFNRFDMFIAASICYGTSQFALAPIFKLKKILHLLNTLQTSFGTMSPFLQCHLAQDPIFLFDDRFSTLWTFTGVLPRDGLASPTVHKTDKQSHVNFKLH